MQHQRIIIAVIGLAALSAVGGVIGATAGGSTASTASPTRTTAPAVPGTAAATVHTAQAAVGGKSETILVNAHGLPLYFYRPDTATRSLVTGGLAQLWPPLTSSAPTAAGLNGRLSVLSDAHGHQVAYNGHLLYTFASDRAGQVTGQGFQSFFVATPGLGPIASSPAQGGTVPAAPPGGMGY
jgi:predicted lipoprotein with Yx(FWY)xxD motif